VEDASARPVPPHSSSKRSRAAEVHNLSEKVGICFLISDLLVLSLVHFPYVMFLGFDVWGMLGRSRREEQD
jgi:hypothetical protein